MVRHELVEVGNFFRLYLAVTYDQFSLGYGLVRLRLGRFVQGRLGSVRLHARVRDFLLASHHYDVTHVVPDHFDVRRSGPMTQMRIRLELERVADSLPRINENGLLLFGFRNFLGRRSFRRTGVEGGRGSDVGSLQVDVIVGGVKVARELLELVGGRVELF